MSRQGSLIKNTLILSVGSVLPKLTTLVTLPILTGCLSKMEYGLFDLISTLITLVLPVATLKIEAAAFRFLIECRESQDEKKEVIATISLFLLPVSLLVILLLYLFMPIGSTVTKFLLCCYFLLDILCLGIQQIARGLSRNVLYSASAIVNSVVYMIMVVIFVSWKSFGLNGLLMSLSAGLFSAILVMAIPLHLSQYVSKQSFSKAKLIKMLAYSWPMIPNTLSSWGMNMSNRLIISGVLGVEANAVYAVANKIPSLFTTVQSSFTYAWQENASMSVNDEDSSAYYSTVFDNLYRILVGCMALLIVVTPWLFQLLIQGDYQEAYYHMPILSISMLFSSMASFLGGIYVAHMRTKSVGITTIMAAVLNIVLNIGLIRFIGLYAASVSTLISFVLLTLYRMYDVRKFQKMRYNIKLIITHIVGLSIMALIQYADRAWLNIVNLVFGIVFVVAVNKKTIAVVLAPIFQKNR